MVGAGVFGYTKQFWRPRLVRAPSLSSAAPISTPDDAGVHGVAETLEGGLPGDRALVRQLGIWSGDGGLFRRIDAVPFSFTPDAGERGVVSGVCALPLDRSRAELVSAGKALATLHAQLGLPAEIGTGASLIVERSVVRNGDRIAVIGEARDEVVPALCRLIATRPRRYARRAGAAGLDQAERSMSSRFRIVDGSGPWSALPACATVSCSPVLYAPPFGVSPTEGRPGAIT